MRVTTVALLAIGLLLLTGALLLLDYMRQPHLVIVDGDEFTVRGQYATVAELLEAAAVTVRPEDHVWPSLAHQPPDAEATTVQHASPVRLSVDGRSIDVWTHQTRLGSFLAENNLGLQRSALISVDDTPIPSIGLKDAQLGSSVQVSNQVDIVIRDGLDEIVRETSAATVGLALAKAGIDVYSTDQVQPPLSSRLRPGLEIAIERAVPVTLQLDGRELDTRTKKSVVADILAEAGLGLNGTDTVSPPMDSEIEDAEKIAILRSTAAYQLTESPLAFSSRLQPQETLEIDQRSLVSAGSPGIISRLMRVEPRNSEALGQTLVGEWVSAPPVDEIIGYGTNVVVKSIDTPAGPLSYWRVVRMRATAYTAADAGKPPTHPAYGITASGRPAGYGVVAVDPEVVPFRSQVYVPGYGVGFAGDTGGGVRGRWIDLGYDEGEIVTWNGYVDVYYLTPVPESNQINYLIPSALP
jgi:uncharacterized protein YabE (DUF348 family)